MLRCIYQRFRFRAKVILNADAATVQESEVIKMPDDDERQSAQNTAEEGHHLVSAAVLGRLAAEVAPGTVQALRQQNWWTETSRVASDWQAMSVFADFWELALVPKVQPGRSNELVGLIASGGEQLGLAVAAIIEAELWSVFRRDNPPDLRTVEGRVVDAAHEMAQRAMADMAMHYLLAIGHTVVNVTARALALDSRLHPPLLDALGTWCRKHSPPLVRR